MSIEELTKLCQELAEVIRFHELEAVDSMAADLLTQVDNFDEVGIAEDTESTEEWIESIRIANLVKTSR